MMADNVGYGDIGAYGAGEVRGMPTPRIDQIAGEGLRLTQYLVEPACTPSRAAFMTGRYSVRSGLSTIIVGGTPNTLQASEVTLGELFKSRGYATGYRRQVASRGERAELADPPGLRRVPRRRPRDHRRHLVSREHAARRHARGGDRRGRALHLGRRSGREPEEGAALHSGLPPAGRGRHRQGVGRLHRPPGRGRSSPSSSMSASRTPTIPR